MDAGDQATPANHPPVGWVERVRRLRGQHGWSGVLRRATMGVLAPLRRLWLRLAHHRNYVFVFDPTLPEPVRPAGMVVERYDRLNEVPEEVRAALVGEYGAASLGVDEWEMDRAGVLWVALVEGQFAGASMSRRGRHFRKWFVPIQDDDIVIFRNRTSPRFRGRGICPALMRHIIAYELIGGGQAYVDCRVYNKPSIRSIEKAGFRRIATLKPITAREALPASPASRAATHVARG